MGPRSGPWPIRTVAHRTHEALVLIWRRTWVVTAGSKFGRCGVDYGSTRGISAMTKTGGRRRRAPSGNAEAKRPISPGSPTTRAMAAADAALRTSGLASATAFVTSTGGRGNGTPRGCPTGVTTLVCPGWICAGGRPRPRHGCRSAQAPPASLCGLALGRPNAATFRQEELGESPRTPPSGETHEALEGPGASVRALARGNCGGVGPPVTNAVRLMQPVMSDRCSGGPPAAGGVVRRIYIVWRSTRAVGERAGHVVGFKNRDFGSIGGRIPAAPLEYTTYRCFRTSLKPVQSAHALVCSLPPKWTPGTNEILRIFFSPTNLGRWPGSVRWTPPRAPNCSAPETQEAD